MFGQNNPIYSQIPQASVPGVTPEMQMVAQEQAKPKGMFAGASIDLGRALAGYLAGIGNPAGVQALQAMNESRQRLLEHQQSLEDYNRKRADDNTDFQAHRQFEIANPLPREPGEFEQALIASGTLPGTPEWTKAMATRAQNMLDPVVMSPQGPMTRSQLLGGGGQPAPAGITFTPVQDHGGPAPQAPGGFSY